MSVFGVKIDKIRAQILSSFKRIWIISKSYNIFPSLEMWAAFYAIVLWYLALRRKSFRPQKTRFNRGFSFNHVRDIIRREKFYISAAERRPLDNAGP